MKPFPQLRFHTPSKEFYIYRHGRREYLGRNFVDAQRRYSLLKAEHDRTSLPEAKPVVPEAQASGTTSPMSISVAELLAAYIAFRLRDGAEQRELARIKTACQHVRPLFAITPANEFRAKALKAVRQALVDAVRPPRTKMNHRRRHITPRATQPERYSRRYINHLVDTIKAIWQWGVSDT